METGDGEKAVQYCFLNVTWLLELRATEVDYISIGLSYSVIGRIGMWKRPMGPYLSKGNCVLVIVGFSHSSSPMSILNIQNKLKRS